MLELCYNRRMSIRIVFMGSPEFALPTLAGLAKGYNVVGVVTQPDREAGRGRVLTPPPVKVLAQELGLPVMQPLRLKQPEALAQLQAWQPDLIVVAAFGQILRQSVLDLPRFGCLNVHASLLPRWRGASPVQAAIWEGDTTTGVTIMKMDAGLDTGPILAEQTEPIWATDTAGSLGERLAKLGADLLLEILPAYLSGRMNLQPQPIGKCLAVNFSQDSAGFLRTIRMGYFATYAPMLKKEDGQLRFEQPVQRLERQVRALNPWPGAFFFWQGQPLKVLQAEAIWDGNVLGDMPVPVVGRKDGHLVLRTEWAGQTQLAIGELGQQDGWPVVGALGGMLLLREVQPAGKKPMRGDVFLRGAREWGRRD